MTVTATGIAGNTVNGRGLLVRETTVEAETESGIEIETDMDGITLETETATMIGTVRTGTRENGTEGPGMAVVAMVDMVTET